MATAAKRILCIEDDPETAALIAEDLQERGYSVVVALDGRAGVDAIIKTEPAIVLCDVSMPHLNGFDVLQNLTALAPQFENLPFIFLTALADRDTELKARRLGADDFVTKPIDFEILATIIEARLGKVGRTEVWSRLIDLNPREIETLTMSAQGKTSAQIANILGLSKRTVDFHIENACRKLDAATRIEAAVKASSRGLIRP
jgi:DNA-binding NarL/FixJ family response regulator